MDRDPRIDPQVGDITENLNGTWFKIIARDEDFVTYEESETQEESDFGYGNEFQLKEWISCAYLDKIIKVA